MTKTIAGYRTATLHETPEAFLVVTTDGERLLDVVESFPADQGAFARRRETVLARTRPSGALDYATYAVVRATEFVVEVYSGDRWAKVRGSEGGPYSLRSRAERIAEGRENAKPRGLSSTEGLPHRVVERERRPAV